MINAIKFCILCLLLSACADTEPKVPRPSTNVTLTEDFELELLAGFLTGRYYMEQDYESADSTICEVLVKDPNHVVRASRTLFYYRFSRESEQVSEGFLELMLNRVDRKTAEMSLRPLSGVGHKFQNYCDKRFPIRISTLPEKQDCSIGFGLFTSEGFSSLTSLGKQQSRPCDLLQRPLVTQPKLIISHRGIQFQDILAKKKRFVEFMRLPL
ncbi:MAG: hypothetical protein HRU19_25525 [Pseudobacteriovorax sp.]|nr:hypothetical protein [Pseudobacteriovorax sp.]